MAGGDGADDEREWKVSLSDLEPDDGEASGDGSDGDADGDPADEGPSSPPPVEPGSPSPENVAFFLLGVVAAVAVLYALLP